LIAPHGIAAQTAEPNPGSDVPADPAGKQPPPLLLKLRGEDGVVARTERFRPIAEAPAGGNSSGRELVQVLTVRDGLVVDILELAPSPGPPDVELLYFEGCPNQATFLPHLRQLLADAGTDLPIRLVRVESAQEAERLRFLGSPSLRVDGRDVDPAAENRTDFGLQCRVYRSAQGVTGTPPDGPSA